MSHLIWSPRALRDAQRIYRFLAAKNADAAKRALAAIRRGVRPLQDYPELGRPAFDLGRSYRRLTIPFGNDGYVLIYRVDGDAVTLLSLRHQKESGP